jgi:glycosyltransferase involved in cell wall biosynthesis
LLVPEKDANALAAAVVRLKEDHELRRRLASRARQFAIERLSWDSSIQAFEHALEGALLR